MEMIWVSIILAGCAAGQSSSGDAPSAPKAFLFSPVTFARTVAHYTVPVYPAASLKAKKGGLAVASLKVDETGKVTSVIIEVAPDEDIRKSVAETITNWQFTPARVHGKAHPAMGKILFYFNFDKQAGEVVIPNVTDRIK